MNYQTRKLLRQLGVILIAAAVMAVLPRLLIASFTSAISLAVLIATIWMFYRIFSPISRDLRRRYGKKRPQSYYSDRR